MQSTQETSTSYQFIGNLIEANGEAFFIDGSRYEGTWDGLGMAGAGSYKMPHDVIYEGEIRDGMNHGNGSLVYPGNQVIDGVWDRGGIKKLKYTFSDGLVFENEENWNYCKFPDRRFYLSIINGLNPAGKSLKTQNQPTKIIPSGCYDSGEGIFDPSTLCVTNFDQPSSKIIKIPTTNEAEWIMKHCRKGGTNPTGYKRWLNENWSSNPPKLSYKLPFSNNSPEKWWKRIFTFERDKNVINVNERREIGDQTVSKSDISYKSYDENNIQSVCTSKRDFQSSSITETVNEDENICCNDKNSDQSFIDDDFNSLRRVICGEINSDEYEGEDDFLATVCCPPEDIYRVVKRKEKSSHDFIKEEMYEEMIKEEEFETEEDEDEESLIISTEFENEEEVYDEYSYSDDIIEEKLIGGPEMDDLKSLISYQQETKGSSRLEQEKNKRKPTNKLRKKKLVEKPKRQNKKQQPCPKIVDTDNLLQRKVGDLLFSPALVAPRSPVYLTRKECDKKSCVNNKSRSTKKDSKLPNLSANKKRGCKNNVKLNTEKTKICQNLEQFITVPN